MKPDLYFRIFALVCLLTATGCAGSHSVNLGKYEDFVQTGDATWYGKQFHGRPTASGEKYNMRKLTAAHHFLPFGTRVRVTNLGNGRSVVVRINDRVPPSTRCAIDLSRTSFKKIAPLEIGRIRVKIEVVD